MVPQGLVIKAWPFIKQKHFTGDTAVAICHRMAIRTNRLTHQIEWLQSNFETGSFDFNQKKLLKQNQMTQYYHLTENKYNG